MRPKLYLFIGYPGAGKTTIAKIIERETGAVHIWADVERHQLFSSPTHSKEESQQLYDKLNIRAKQLLKDGKSVIFDTNFNYLKDRQHLSSLASSVGADPVVIWVNTPLQVAKHRAVDSHISRNLYEMTMDEGSFNKIVSKLEKPLPSEQVVKIDGTRTSRKQVVAKLKDYL